ncbi:hypothetical protein [Streptomyces sp. NPDC057623]|uniref:hypothetical protein n=1 Tax=Streptomyces sp. NPDC057623 TaxID=3346187 RepID=UPI00367EEE48
MSLLGVGASAQAAPSAAQAQTPPAANESIATDLTTNMSTRSWNMPWKRKLVHVKSLGMKCGKKPLAAASGRGEMTLRIDETRTVNTTTSKDINATIKIINAGVGWDVTKGRSITVSGSKEVPHGKYGTLTAYTKYSGKKFDVLDTVTMGIIQKNKEAWKPIGVCFKYSQR